jgi:hypothetical protein
VELFKAVLKWVDSECARQGITNINENKTARRRVLDDSVYDIRFLAMSVEDFTKYVSFTGILTEIELVSLFQKFGGSDVVDLKWKEQEERRQKYSRNIVGFTRFEVGNVQPGDSSSIWSYGDGRNSDALTLTANKAVLFHGVRLFGDSNGSQYNVKFGVKNENVTGTYTSERDKDGVCGYDVMLPKPISLKPNEEFTIVATIKGPTSQAGANGKSSVNVDGTIITFRGTDYSSHGLVSNSTDITRGQFYKLFVSNC